MLGRGQGTTRWTDDPMWRLNGRHRQIGQEIESPLNISWMEIGASGSVRYNEQCNNKGQILGTEQSLNEVGTLPIHNFFQTARTGEQRTTTTTTTPTHEMGTLQHMNLEQLILWVFETSCHGYVINTIKNLYNDGPAQSREYLRMYVEDKA